MRWFGMMAWVVLLGGVSAAACGSKASAPAAENSEENAATAGAKSTPNAGGRAPATAAGEGNAAPDISPSTSRAALLSSARSAMSKKEYSLAISYADVLVQKQPNDAEAVAIRAQALQASGATEEAKADFALCCELGQTACCQY